MLELNVGTVAFTIRASASNASVSKILSEKLQYRSHCAVQGVLKRKIILDRLTDPYITAACDFRFQILSAKNILLN